MGKSCTDLDTESEVKENVQRELGCRGKCVGECSTWIWTFRLTTMGTHNSPIYVRDREVFIALRS